MRIPRVFNSATIATGNDVVLDASASQHIARALRMQPGDSLVLFDGSGVEFAATITGIAKKQVSVSVAEPRATDVESPLSIHLGIAISRGERMDWVIQKATELGVACISPLFTERVEVKLAGERAEKKLRHWRQVAVSACEQCGRNTLPDIASLQHLDSWLSNTNAARKFVLHHRADMRPADETMPESVALLVGPEGGLSIDEIRQAESCGYYAMRLGPRVLRTETAPLAAIAILQSLWGDMSI